MSLLFPNSPQLTLIEKTLLADAYDAARDELAAKHGYSPPELARAAGPLTGALFDLFEAGYRGRPVLIQYATSQALTEAQGFFD